MRKISQLFIVTCLAVLSFGVAASDDRQPVLQPGLAVLPPDGDSWNVIQRNQTVLAYGKVGAKKGESYIAVASLFRIPAFETKEQFLEYVKQGRRSSDDPARFEVLENSEVLSERSDALCVRHERISRDKAAEYDGEAAEYLLLDVIGLNCRHPFDDTLGVNFEYTHRHFEGTRDADYVPAAERFLQGLKFVKF